MKIILTERSRLADRCFRPPITHLPHSSNVKSWERDIVQVPVRCFCVIIWVLFTLITENIYVGVFRVYLM